MKFFQKANTENRGTLKTRELSVDERVKVSGGECVEKVGVCKDTGGGHIVCTPSVICASK